MAGIVIAGTHSGCGKTTVTLGVMAALVRRGIKVQPFKVGPDYIDPMFHTYITGRESRNLDSWLLEETVLKDLFMKNVGNAEIAIVEGVMGLYDGYGGDSIIASTAHVAQIIKTPVVLVVNGDGLALSIVALIKGFKEFDPEVSIGGVIINNINTKAHYLLLKEMIQIHLGMPVLGYLPTRNKYKLSSRHLGLITNEEVTDLNQRVDYLANQVEATIDLEQLLKLAELAEVLTGSGLEFSIEPREQPLRIAVAKDRAFNFYYADNLDLLRKFGAELIFFSPLADHQLPENIAGLYLGGGYPEVWAAQLQANRTMRDNIKNRIEDGLPTYAECGGLMYLTQKINVDGKSYEMVGVIPGRSEMTSQLQRFGYVEIQIIEDNVISQKGARIRGHEFHFSVTEASDQAHCCFSVSKTKSGKEIQTWRCGFKIKNLIAGYAHLHFWSNPDFAKTFIDSCCKYSGKVARIS